MAVFVLADMAPIKFLTHMEKRFLLLFCVVPLAGWHVYLYQDVRNETPLPCRITASGITRTLEPGETVSCATDMEEDVPVLIEQEGAGQLTWKKND